MKPVKPKKEIAAVYDFQAGCEYSQMKNYFEQNNIVDQKRRDLINAVLMQKRSAIENNKIYVVGVCVKTNLADIVLSDADDTQIKNSIRKNLEVLPASQAEEKFKAAAFGLQL